MTAGPLSTYLLDVCDDVDTLTQGAVRNTLNQARQSLAEPLRVAVVGRVKAGKSTLVNALIGRRVAQTAATECTRVVTWYRHGRPPSAQVVLPDGQTTPLPLIDGLPETLGVPLEQVDRVEVSLPERPLTGFTLIDTPGLATLTDELADASRDAVVGDALGDSASRSAAGQVDAVIYVFRDVRRQDDVEFVQQFQAATGDLGASAVNAIGVLSHADVFGAGPWANEDPIDAALAQAAKISQRQEGMLAEVVPVAGLLSETARSGRLTEKHAAALARLGGVHDAFLKSFTNPKSLDKIQAAGVSDATLRALLRILGPYGVRHGRTVATAGGGATAVYEWCNARAGVEHLERMLAERFTRRADVLKAGKVLATLDRLVYDLALDAGVKQALATRLEEAHLDPRLHPIRELRAAENLRRRPRRDPVVLESLERLLDADDPAVVLGADNNAADLRQLALERASWAGGVAATASPDLELAEAARVLSHSYLLLSDRLT